MRRAAAILFLFCISLSMVHGPWSIDCVWAAARPPVEAELVSEMDGVRPGKETLIGVRLKMDKGWHTYWVNPGDSGMATSVEWELPEGFRAGPLEWPYPRKFDTAGLVSYGYSGEIMPVSAIEAPAKLEAGGLVRLRAKVSWLGCKNICLPGEAVLALRLPVKEEPRADPRWKGLFGRTRSEWPVKSPEGWRMRAFDGAGRLILILGPPEGVSIKKAEFFPEDREIVDYSEPQVFGKGERNTFIEIPKSRSMTNPPARLRGVLVSPGGWGAGKAKAISVDVKVEPNQLP